ncbi:MAG: hypothetical protein ACXWUG_05270 [Polyangiales bacterium]
MNTSYAFLLSIALVPTFVACSASKESETGTLGAQDSGGGLNTSDGALGDGDFVLDGELPETTGGTPTDCAEAATYVYALDSDNTLYKFDPKVASKAAFTSIGIVDCGSGTSPNSMAIARDGTAYVDLMNGTSCKGVYKVDIKTAACKGATPFSCGSSGFGQFGMGFSTNSASTTAETLFIGDTNASKMATLDPASGAVKVVGTLPASGPEFTGNAAGELWAFMPQASPPKVAQLDKTTGKAIKTFNLSALKTSILVSPSAWAFAFWGGDYYIFLQGDLDSSTNVWKMTSAGVVTKYIADTGFRIVGAGVSTCAPLSIK